MKHTDRREMKSSNLKISNHRDSSASRDKQSVRDLTPHKTSINKQNVEKEKRSGFYTQPRSQKNEEYPKQLDKNTDELRIRRDRMQACISLFNLMHSNNMQLRCLQHNNVLTLYCLTERRVLCVNCIYGVTKHRTHKVLPLKDSATFITEDNILLRNLIDSDLKVLEESIRCTQQNTITLEREMKRCLEELESEFHNKIDELKNKYDNDREKIKETYETLIEKAKFLEKGVDQFKFKIWETLSKIGIGKRNEATNNETDVVRQIFCVNLSEMTRFEIKKLTKRQLERLKSRL